jgi:hypothetical protein
MSYATLAADWLPVSSAGSLSLLDLRSSNIKRLPEGLTALENLMLDDCKGLLGHCQSVALGA